jgi:hypothetical protein
MPFSKLARGMIPTVVYPVMEQEATRILRQRRYAIMNDCSLYSKLYKKSKTTQNKVEEI